MRMSAERVKSALRRCVPAAMAACLVLAAAPPRLQAADDVVLWHFRLTVNKVVDGKADTPQAPKISAHVARDETLMPLVLEFDVNQDVDPIRKSLRARYDWTMKERQYLSGMLAAKSDGSGKGSSLEDWTVRIVRRFAPVPCEPDLYVDDDWRRMFGAGETSPGGAPPAPKGDGGGDRIDIDIDASFKVKVTAQSFLVGNEPATTDESVESYNGSAKVPYAYRAPKLDKSVGPAASNLPGGMIVPAVSFARYTIDAAVERKPTDFKLTASPAGRTAIRFANKILVNGRDESRMFKVRRFERDWIHWNVGNAPVSGWELINDWHEVTADGNREPARTVSFGGFFPPKFPGNKREDRIYLVEFLDAVDGFPEFGFLYHPVLLGTARTGKGRVQLRAFEARQVDADGWCEIRARNSGKVSGMGNTLVDVAFP